MSLSDVTMREHVLKSIGEFDRLGREQFLDRYGFDHSRSFWLVHNGRKYDSKAIIGAAHRYARPDLGPLKVAEFSGGESTVQRKLEELGFTVEVDDLHEGPTPGRSSNAFIVTWKETGWPHAHVLRLLRAFNDEGAVDEPWRFQAHRMAKTGDRVWLLKQGPGPKGIFGSGRITGPARMGDAGNGKRQMMAPIRFTRLADPKVHLLVGEVDTRRILTDQQMRAQASGYPITDEQAAQLERLLPSSAGGRPIISPNEADEKPFDPKNVEDARKRIMRQITERRGQRQFRDALIAAYRGKCAITGCDVLDVLEAAHIYPYRGQDTNDVTNGLLLRADIHTLFDCGLLAVDASTRKVIVAPQIRSGEYGILHGKPLRPTAAPREAASEEALERHRRENGI